MMKRFVFPVLILVAGVAAGASTPTEPGASPPDPEPAELLYGQTFVFEDAVVGLPYNSSSHRILADDFELDEPAVLGRVVIWGIFNDHQYVSDYMVWLFADSDGMPTGNPLDGVFIVADDITFTDTGYAFGGAHIWKIDMPFDPGDEFTLDAGTRYWFAVQAQYPYTCYWVCEAYDRFSMAVYSANDGASWEDTHDAFGYDCDAFMELHGYFNPEVKETSWGEIKASF
ncbi:MAG: hypothetical protein A2Y64_03160 [Candidatus Coatesbacteria bacterium RBG_13_66_14]|uniref:DUF4185 domain-containing protein n=1 Tax=Candidatus Coatesbacteria bacterium RBG_13_66_14 TaxID=1817816 RepID=A0A1F5EYL6_9BACT|nr:MAG: hypothetical protein A2Y64_03160 [Candidatus Coatesbacteria bacterium RBG_13_66_14]